MDYTSPLETFEGFSIALARHCAHQVGDWAILYTLDSQVLLMVVNNVPGSL